MKKENGYWTKERCFEAAREYETKAEFRKNYPTACKKAYQNGWVKEFTWFVDGKKVAYENRIKESYKRCREAALSCDTIKEFIENFPNETAIAYRRDWVSEYTWLEREKKPNGYWNYNTCLDAAKDCKTLKEFINRYSRAYEIARRNDWLKEYTWLVYGKTPYNDKCEYVYGYFFKEHNAVYIGLTLNPNRRDKEHRSEKNNTTVYKYSQLKSVEIPLITILESELSTTDAKEKEGFYVDKYKNEGWIVLNQAATGIFSSSLGQIGRKWTYEKCYEAAFKCKTKMEFDRRFRGASASAHENGWIKDYTWFVNRNYYNYDSCKEKALLCKSRGEFQEKYPQVYQHARKHKWLDDYTWFSKPKTAKTWDYDSCYKEALDCTSKSDFANKFSRAYKVAKDNGWLKDYTWFVKPKNWNAIWDYETCKKEANKYSSRGEFQTKSKKAYMYAYHQHLLDDFFPKAA